MPEFEIGSEDDWKAELEEHPELAACERESLFADGALERALRRVAAGEVSDAGALRAAEANAEPALEDLLRGAVDLSAGVSSDAATQGIVGSAPSGREDSSEAAAKADVNAAAAVSFGERGAHAVVQPPACSAAYGRERTRPARSSERAQATSEEGVFSSGAPDAGKQRVFDLHCDTLDRLALHGAEFPTMWTEHDANVPGELLSSLSHNACHLALDRMAQYAWCQCFAVFIPDEFRGDAAWRLFQRVRRYFDAQMQEHADLVEQVRDGRRVDDVLASGKAAAILTVEGAAFLEDPLFAGQSAQNESDERSLDVLADFIARSREAEADADADRALREAELSGRSLTDEEFEAIERAREEAAQRKAAREREAELDRDEASRKRERDPFFRLEEAARAGVKMMTLTWNGPNALGSGHDTAGGLTRFGREVVGQMERLRMVVDVSHLNDRGFSDLQDVATRPFAASHSNARSVCGHRRNLTDAQARAVFSGGGLVGLNFCRDFLRADGGDPTPDDVLRHVDRLLTLGGERGLALGSDYDGTDVPSWLDGCQHVGSLHDLIERHFGGDVAERIFYENARDFFARNEG